MYTKHVWTTYVELSLDVFFSYLHVGLQYCWGLDTSSDVKVYKIGVESK